MSSAVLSPVPKVRMATFFNQEGVRSMNVAPTASKGEDAGARRPATRWLTPSAAATDSTPLRTCTRTGTRVAGATGACRTRVVAMASSVPVGTDRFRPRAGDDPVTGSAEHRGQSPDPVDAAHLVGHRAGTVHPVDLQ